MHFSNKNGKNGKNNNNDHKSNKKMEFKLNEKLKTMENLNHIINFALENISPYTHINYATTISRIGKVYYFKENINLVRKEKLLEKDSKLDKFLDHVIEKIKLEDYFGGQGLANILHALSKISHPRAFEVFDTVMGNDKISKDVLLKKGKPQAIANTIWALAKIIEYHNHNNDSGNLDNNSSSKDLIRFCDGLLQNEGKARDRLFKEGKPQEIANTIWALATMDFYNGKTTENDNIFQFFRAMMSTLNNDKNGESIIIEKICKEGNPQAIANTIWALASMDLHNGKTV